MNLSSVLILPSNYVRNIWLAVAAAGVVLSANSFRSPSVAPSAPAELRSEDVAPAAVQVMTAEDSLDFIFRPLFWTSRRPPKAVEQEIIASQQVAVDVDTSSLDGYSLLGVFSSGERQGVIVETKEDERLRLYMGDQLDGWRLVGTSLRQAFFEAPDGSSAGLELAVASSLPPPASAVPARAPAKNGDSEAGGSGSVASDLTDEPSSPKSEAMTFGAIAERKLREARAAQSEQGERR